MPCLPSKAFLAYCTFLLALRWITSMSMSSPFMQQTLLLVPWRDREVAMQFALANARGRKQHTMSYSQRILLLVSRDYCHNEYVFNTQVVIVFSMAAVWWLTSKAHGTKDSESSSTWQGFSSAAYLIFGEKDARMPRIRSMRDQRRERHFKHRIETRTRRPLVSASNEM